MARQGTSDIPLKCPALTRANTTSLVFRTPKIIIDRARRTMVEIVRCCLSARSRPHCSIPSQPFDEPVYVSSPTPLIRLALRRTDEPADE